MPLTGPNQTSFKPGQSGNPAGKPKGAKDRRRELIAMFDHAAPELIENAIRIANEGDPSMMRTCIERILPKKREETYVSLPELKYGMTFDEKAKVIEEAAFHHKEISVEIWDLMLKNFCRVFEISEIDRRLKILEAKEKFRESNIEKV